MSRSQMEKEIKEAEKKSESENVPSYARNKLVYMVIRILAIVILFGLLAAIFVVPLIRGR